MGVVFTCVMTLVVMSKVFYYIWAFVGGILFFTEVRGREETEATGLSTSLLVLTIINIVDVARCSLIVLLFSVVHLICKRRVRSNMGLNALDYDNLQADMDAVSPNIIRDTENYYRFKEFSKSEHRLIKKKFKLIKCEGSSMCAICCDDMVEGTMLSCDGKHIYHQECIQMWLTKQRKCPLCKTRVI